ncbi:MAG: hypothetical protein ACKOKG_11875, partial [Verrucomicrobiota bacterium]
MPSKSKTESSRPTSRKALAPTVFVLALIGVLAWGVWRVVKSPGDAGAKSVSASSPGKALAVPVPAPAPTPALVSNAIPSRQTSAPPVLPTPVLIPTPPAASNAAAIPATPSPPMTAMTTVSNQTGLPAGTTSAPVVLSTQVFRASLAVPEAMPSNAVPLSGASSNS